MDPGRPGSLETLRQRNRLRVLDVLRRRGAASRADIGRETGLSRTSVSSLVAELLDEGLVAERPEHERRASSPGGGRPSTPLVLDPSAGVLLGIDFGHDAVRVALADLSYSMLGEETEALDVDHEAEQALDAAARMAGSLVRGSRRVVGAGAAVSAPLRAGSRALTSPAIFPSWFDRDVRGELEARLRVPVAVGNDANLGALAEARLGAGRTVDNVVYVMLSAGVGAGLVLGGEVYEGETGTAGELGHVVVDPGGLVCRCGGRGCLETVAGASAIVGALRHSHGGELTLPAVLRLAADGDPGPRRAIADAGRAVGRAVAGVCSLLDPGVVVVGGALAAAGDLLLDGIRESVGRTMSPSAGRGVAVVPGKLGARAEVLGAILLAADNVPVEAA